MEIWKDIEDYEGIYQVSNLGRVKSLARTVYMTDAKIRKTRDTLLSQHVNEKGYLHVSLTKNGKTRTKRTHRLVAQAFLKNPENLKEVNHRDGNKENNEASNLEWVTRKENVEHAITSGLFNPKRNGIASGILAKKAVVATRDGEPTLRFESLRDAERYFDAPGAAGAICRCCKGKQKKAYGYRWRYEKELGREGKQ